MLCAFHDSTMGGHSGVPVTYRRLRRLFACPKMKEHIKYVQSCSVCQQAKPERVRYPGLLEPLPVPDGAWKVVTMDFIDGLPSSGKFNCILVVVNKFTRYGHFLALSHPFTAAKVAHSYLENIYKLHGLPEAIVSDRDPVFTSSFWRELFKTIGTELNMSTPYHPQTDGQIERVNQCLEIYLRCFTHANPNKWHRYLALAEFWYNSSFHSALNTSPFAALYGHEPRHWGIEAASTCKLPQLKEWLEERKHMQQVLAEHLHQARNIMKSQADKKRSDRSFVVGDSVFVKLQPYVQKTVARRSNHKLSFRYFGPYKIIRIVNPVAYELELPAGAKVHPVFHVSQLRRALSPATPVETTLPTPTEDP
uniref:Integrase catalytic domain-containing protein n=1 Tax=Triticum urartu TaxID=4572 RepID=A0A8R7PHM6_TRIUA